MASIRQEAQDVLDVTRDQIGWIAVWRNGRSWYCFTFWPDVIDEHKHVEFSAYEVEQLRNILKTDPKAVIVNGYYDNLGDAETMTRDSLADALRWQYEQQASPISDFIAEE